jgi:hypothetical protein
MPALPDRRNYRKDWKHFIAIPCLGGKYIGHVSIDSKYLLYKDPYSYELAVLPPLGSEHPSFEELVFYTNCLAYDHDLPTLLLPEYGRVPVEPLRRHGRKHSRDRYCEEQCVVLESLGSLKWGSLQYVQFRWGDLEQAVDLSYSSQYRCAAKELSLYSLALRQFDPLSEFLHYYRIMESVDGKKGKNWIANNLERIGTFDFGFLELEDGLYFGNPKRRMNLFQLYRRRAQERLKQLPQLIRNQPIQDYFYHVNRCGIAHGRNNLRHYDFSTTVADIWKDLYVIKLLARIAIRDKMGSGNLVRKFIPHERRRGCSEGLPSFPKDE